MASSRTLRPLLSLVAASVFAATLLVLVMLDLIPLGVCSILVPITFILLGAPLIGHEIVLSTDRLEIRCSRELTVTIRREQIVDLAFSSNHLAITTADGTSLAMCVPWYTGKQRDMVIAHLRQSAPTSHGAIEPVAG